MRKEWIVALPVLGGIVEVVADDRPKHLLSRLRVPICYQPLGIANDGNGAKRRTIALRSA